MTKVSVKFWVLIPHGKPDGGDLPTAMSATLVIDKESALPGGSRPPVPGRWTSHNKYLGRTTSGNYVLRNFTREKFGPGTGGLAWDPVGWFLDSSDLEKPFLLLKNFDDANGIGYFVRNPSGVPLRLATLDVEWAKVA